MACSRDLYLPSRIFVPICVLTLSLQRWQTLRGDRRVRVRGDRRVRVRGGRRVRGDFRVDFRLGVFIFKIKQQDFYYYASSSDDE